MPKKSPAKKTAKKVAKKIPSSQMMIDLPPAEELALNIQKELVKLPSQSTHNHLHRLGLKAQQAREMLLGVEIVAPILCALELEHQRKLNHGLKNWTEWVKQNCEFSHMTYTKYNKVLKHARAGDIKDLDSDLIPTVAPSLMSKDELQEVCGDLAEALKGWNGIRQIYLELQIIRTPTRNTITENRGKKTSSDEESDSEESEDEESNETVVDIDLKRKDATFAFRDPLKKIDTAMSREQYRYLPKETLEEIIIALGEHAKALKNI